MKKKIYICKAKQIIKAKTYASALDKERAPHRGALSLAKQIIRLY